MTTSSLRLCIHAPALLFAALELCLTALNAHSTVHVSGAPTTSNPSSKSLCKGRCVPGVTYCSPFLEFNDFWTAQCVANCSATHCPTGTVCLGTQCNLLNDKHICAEKQTQSLPMCYNHTAEQTFEPCGPGQTWCSPKRPYCYDNVYRCNGINNCPEGEDERNCHTEVPTTQANVSLPTANSTVTSTTQTTSPTTHSTPSTGFFSVSSSPATKSHSTATSPPTSAATSLPPTMQTSPSLSPTPKSVSSTSASSISMTPSISPQTTASTTIHRSNSQEPTTKASKAPISQTAPTSTLPSGSTGSISSGTLPSTASGSPPTLSPLPRNASIVPSVTTKIPTSPNRGSSTTNRKLTTSHRTSQTGIPTHITSNTSQHSPTPTSVIGGKKEGLTLGEVIGIAVVSSILVLLIIVVCWRRCHNRGRHDMLSDRYSLYNNDDQRNVPMQTIGRPRFCFGGEDDDADLEDVENLLGTDTNLTNFPEERDELHL